MKTASSATTTINKGEIFVSFRTTVGLYSSFHLQLLYSIQFSQSKTLGLIWLMLLYCVKTICYQLLDEKEPCFKTFWSIYWQWVASWVGLWLLMRSCWNEWNYRLLWDLQVFKKLCTTSFSSCMDLLPQLATCCA